jgi:hypothetical protein
VNEPAGGDAAEDGRVQHLNAREGETAGGRRRARPDELPDPSAVVDDHRVEFRVFRQDQSAGRVRPAVEFPHGLEIEIRDDVGVDDDKWPVVPKSATF